MFKKTFFRLLIRRGEKVVSKRRNYWKSHDIISFKLNKGFCNPEYFKNFKLIIKLFLVLKGRLRYCSKHVSWYFLFDSLSHIFFSFVGSGSKPARGKNWIKSSEPRQIESSLYLFFLLWSFCMKVPYFSTLSLTSSLHWFQQRKIICICYH
jgi:hypothetical protein